MAPCQREIAGSVVLFMKIGNLELDRHRKLTLQFFPQFAKTFTHYYPTSPPTPAPSAPHCFKKRSLQTKENHFDET